MKIAMRLIVAVVTLQLVSVVTVVHAKYLPIYTFNHGIEEDGKSCTVDEWNDIQQAMAVASSATIDADNRPRRGDKRRNLLRSTTPLSNKESHDQGSRQLLLSAKCRACGFQRLCLSQISGCPRLFGGGRRRGLQVQQPDKTMSNNSASAPKKHRKLNWWNNYRCHHQITAIDAALDSMSVSDSCTALLDASRRTIECTWHNAQCDIWGLSVLRANGQGNGVYDEDVVARLNVNSGSVVNTVCRSLASGNGLSIRAESDPSNFNLGAVTLFISGPNGYAYTHVAPTKPYLLYGTQVYNFDGGSDVVAGPPNGADEWPLGDYYVHAYTDGDDTTGREASFTLADC